MTIFQCKRSGNKVHFSSPELIESMRKESGYIEIKENRDEKENEEITQNAYADENPKKVLKQRGRPRKH